MAGPNPLYVDFICRGVPDVLRALKSISEATLKTEHASANAVEASASRKIKAAKKSASDAAKAVSETQGMIAAAERAGTKSVANELRVRLANQTKHLNATYDAYQKTLEGINTNARKKSQDFQKSQEAKFKSLEKLTEKWAKSDEAAAKSAAAAKSKAADKEWSDAVAHLKLLEKEQQKSARSSTETHKKELDKQTSNRARSQQEVEKLLSKERRRAELENKFGVAPAHPMFHPSNRMRLIDAAKNASPEEKRKLLAHIEEMRVGATGSRKAQSERANEERREQKRITSEAKRGEQERSRNAEKVAREERARKEQFNKTVLNAGGAAIKNATSIVGRAASGIVGGVADAAGGFSLQDTISREVSTRGLAAQIASSTNTGLSADTLLSNARSVAISQGMSPEEVLRGYESVKKLNDEALPQAVRVMPDIAKIANVTGTDMGHMGELAANITANNIGISDKDLKKQLRIFAQQGIAGGVEVSDFARYGSRITAGAGLFGGNIEANEATLGAMAQMARQHGGSSSAAEATMSAQRFATDLQKSGQKVQDSTGIKIADGKGTLRNAKDIMLDMLDYTHGDVMKLKTMGLNERGIRALTGAAHIYREAGGGKKGRAAVEKEFEKYTKDISEEEVERRNKQRNAAIDKQLAIAMERLKMEVGTKLMPAFMEFSKKLVALLPRIGELMDSIGEWSRLLANNPMSGVAAALSLSIAQEVAKAGLAATFEKAVEGSLGSMGAISVATAALAITAATIAVQKMSQDEDDRQNRAAGANIKSANAHHLLTEGIKTPEDLAQAKDTAESLKSSIAESGGKNAGGSRWYLASALVGASIADVATLGMAGRTKSVIDAHEAVKKQDLERVADQQKTLDAFVKAISKATEELKNSAPGAKPAASNPANPSRKETLSVR